MKKWILLTMCVCIACAGVTYAGWTDRLDIETSLASGSLALAFGEDSQNYGLTFQTAAGENKSYPAKHVECLDNYALFSLEGECDLFAELLGCSAMELTYPMMEREENTIEDFAISEPQEVLLSCEKAAFVFGENRVELSEEQRAAYAPTLRLSVNQAADRDAQTGRVSQVYVLDEESRRQLEAAMQLTVPQELTGTGAESVRLEVSYQLSIALNIGQAEQNL